MSLCYGKLDATRSPRLSDLEVYVTGKMPDPPASTPTPAAKWGMDDNDTIGDCTIAGADHLIAAWNADISTHDPRPNDAEISSTYFDLTGGADSGLNEQFVLKTWQTTGLWGNKIKAFAPFDGNNIRTMHQVVAFFRGAYLGIQCPLSAQQQFANGEPWTFVPGSPIEGGHCIVAVAYGPSSVQCVSWGAVVDVTYSFLSNYLDESWAIVSQEMAEHNGDGVGLDLASLLTDIEHI